MKELEDTFYNDLMNNFKKNKDRDKFIRDVTNYKEIYEKNGFDRRVPEAIKKFLEYIKLKNV